MRGYLIAGFMIMVGLVLSGCASHGSSAGGPVAGISTQNAKIVSSLDQAAQSAAASLSELAAIKKAKYPSMLKMPLEHVYAPELNTLVMVKWYGPIAPVLRTIAQKTGYRLQLYGKEPKLPILVRVDDTQHLVSALTLIRDIDLQAGLRASVRIFAKERIISLRYMDNDNAGV